MIDLEQTILSVVSSRVLKGEGMPRFYFHVRKHGDYDEDPEGSEFDSVELAIKEAELAALELLPRGCVPERSLTGTAS